MEKEGFSRTERIRDHDLGINDLGAHGSGHLSLPPIPEVQNIPPTSGRNPKRLPDSIALAGIRWCTVVSTDSHIPATDDTYASNRSVQRSSRHVRSVVVPEPVLNASLLIPVAKSPSRQVPQIGRSVWGDTRPVGITGGWAVLAS
jgi:hypothetical protein